MRRSCHLASYDAKHPQRTMTKKWSRKSSVFFAGAVLGSDGRLSRDTKIGARWPRNHTTGLGMMKVVFSYIH